MRWRRAWKRGAEVFQTWVQRRRGLGFLEEALLGGRILCEVRRQKLDGDRALEAGIAGLIDDAHPPWPSCETISYGPSWVPGNSVIGGGDYIVGLSRPVAGCAHATGAHARYTG